MQPVETFKALTYRLLVLGRQPTDIIIIGGILLILNVFSTSFWVDIIVLVLAFYVAKKGRDRPQSYFTSLMMFLITPAIAAIDYYSDVSSYRAAMKENDSD